jgi:hypothetical protein
MLSLILATVIPYQAAVLDRASFCLLPEKSATTLLIPKSAAVNGQQPVDSTSGNSKVLRYGYTRRSINC